MKITIKKVLPLEAPAPPLEVPCTPPLEVGVLPLEVAGDKLSDQNFQV